MAVKPSEFTNILRNVQTYISENHADALTSSKNYDQIKPYITHYLRRNGLLIEGKDTDELVEELYNEMVAYSFLTPYMDPSRDDVDEININAWDDVVISYAGGKVEKIRSFYSPTHALDVVRKMLNESRATLDDAIPIAEGQLANNGRITAMKYPLVDMSTFVSASIRLLHPSKITMENLIEGGSASEKMLRFLCCCMRYGVSLVVAGATFSGKTTLMNALLKTMPDETRIFTLEAGSRELDLVRRDEESKPVSNVIHTLAKKSEKASQNISLERLVVTAMRFNPALIVVGEMRDEEAYAAIDASLTGHTLVSTIHSFAGEDAHVRLATLCQKRFPMPMEISMMQAAKAFPIICFEQQLRDGSRKITEITECEVDALGHRIYHTLFRYVVERNEIVDGRIVIHGHFEEVEPMSQNLRNRMTMFGMPSVMLEELLRKGGGTV